MSARREHCERFDVAPLLERVFNGNGGGVSHAALVLGIDRTQIYAYKRHGLTAERADVLAVRAGLHPAEVWSEWENAS